MDYIKGVTYGFMARKGTFLKSEARESLRLLKERTSATHVIFAIAAEQETAHSTKIYYEGDFIVSDGELLQMIGYAQELDLKIIIKPMVNTRCGTWRAHINFFDIDVPCEPKWSDWFNSYTEFQLHYAELAQKVGAEMLIIGCEMVQTERREKEWRELIRKVREVYHGLISYNTDKYQEDNVKWWDAVDVISSSGYYPMEEWDSQIARIQRIIEPYHKPFFFAEAGCPSREGSSVIPNDWTWGGKLNLEEQRRYYEVMFEKTGEIPWIQGFGLWDWSAVLYGGKEALADDGYCVYGKPAEVVIKNFYEKSEDNKGE